MIGKQIKGKSFSRTLNYVLGKETAEIVASNMMSTDAKGLANEFKLSRSLRPNLQKVVYHTSLSLPEGERLSSEQWGKVAEKYLTKMGFQGGQFVAVKHEDTEHQHIHIVASRVRLDGTVVSDSQDYRRSEKAIRGIEKEYGLTRVLSSHQIERRAPTSGELRQTLRTGVPSVRSQLQTLVDGALSHSEGAGEFLTNLEKLGVQTKLNQAKTGHISGISFILDGETMKGSDLGRGYSWKGLQRRGLIYEQNKSISENFRKASRGQVEQADSKSSQSSRHSGRAKDGFSEHFIRALEYHIAKAHRSGFYSGGGHSLQRSGVNPPGESSLRQIEKIGDYFGPNRKSSKASKFLEQDVSDDLDYSELSHRGYDLREYRRLLRQKSDEIHRARRRMGQVFKGSLSKVGQADSEKSHQSLLLELDELLKIFDLTPVSEKPTIDDVLQIGQEKSEPEKEVPEKSKSKGISFDIGF